MFAAYIIVTVVAAAANIYAATNDFTRPEWLLANMAKLGVPESSLTTLGVLKAAGALGLLVGIKHAPDWDCCCRWAHTVLCRCSHHPCASARLLFRRASHVPSGRLGCTRA